MFLKHPLATQVRARGAVLGIAENIALDLAMGVLLDGVRRFHPEADQRTAIKRRGNKIQVSQEIARVRSPTGREGLVAKGAIANARASETAYNPTTRLRASLYQSGEL
jgi:hypothetical protein